MKGLQKAKKLSALLLAFAMCMSVMPQSAYAMEQTPVAVEARAETATAEDALAEETVDAAPTAEAQAAPVAEPAAEALADVEELEETVTLSSDEWAAVEDTFTVEAIQEYIPDLSFATAVYNDISAAIQEDTYHADKTC